MQPASPRTIFFRQTGLTLACLFAFAKALTLPASAQSRIYRPPAVYAQLTQPDQAQGRKILDDFRSRGIDGDYYLEFQLRMLPRRGDERDVAGRMWGGRNDLGPISRIVLQPGSKDERRLLVQNGPRGSVWTWPGALGGGVDHLRDTALFTPLADTIVTAFDLQMPFIYWSDFVFEGTAPVNGRPANVFLMYPPADIRTRQPGLVGVRMYVDTQFNALVQAQEIGDGNRLLKSITVLDLKKISDQWIVRTIDVRDERTRDKTQFLVTAAALGLDFTGDLLTPDGLSQTVLPPDESRIRRLGSN